ncbi:MAG: transporter, partial [Syntrophobacteraceae bacterium]|nr:transporter [Syntrophobacteraceae bacterium]
MKRWGVVVILSLHMLIPATASAQNNARDGIAAPPGTILSVLYGYHYFGDYLKADGKTVPMDKVDLQGNYGLWREVFYFQVGSFVANAQFLLPFGNASLDLNHTSLSTSGIGDPSILTTFWFINRESTKTYLSFTPWFYFPLGNYSN